jgi:hypothetical protein
MHKKSVILVTLLAACSPSLWALQSGIDLSISQMNDQLDLLSIRDKDPIYGGTTTGDLRATGLRGWLATDRSRLDYHYDDRQMIYGDGDIQVTSHHLAVRGDLPIGATLAARLAVAAERNQIAPFNKQGTQRFGSARAEGITVNGIRDEGGALGLGLVWQPAASRWRLSLLARQQRTRSTAQGVELRGRSANSAMLLGAIPANSLIKANFTTQQNQTQLAIEMGSLQDIQLVDGRLAFRIALPNQGLYQLSRPTTKSIRLDLIENYSTEGQVDYIQTSDSQLVNEIASVERLLVMAEQYYATLATKGEITSYEIAVEWQGQRWWYDARLELLQWSSDNMSRIKALQINLITDNTILELSLGRMLHRNVGLYLGGTLYQHQWLGVIPSFYNAYSANRFDRPYGVATLGLRLSF